MSRFISARSSQRIVTTISARKPLIKFPLFLNNILLARPVMEVQILLYMYGPAQKRNCSIRGSKNILYLRHKHTKSRSELQQQGRF
jgi:hypothetical protein